MCLQGHLDQAFDAWRPCTVFLLNQLLVLSLNRSGIESFPFGEVKTRAGCWASLFLIWYYYWSHISHLLSFPSSQKKRNKRNKRKMVMRNIKVTALNTCLRLSLTHFCVNATKFHPVLCSLKHCVWVCMLSHCVQLFENLRAVPHQAPLSMEFSRWEFWSGVPFPSPGHFLTQGSTCVSCRSCIAGGFFTAEPPEERPLSITFP